jgi:hypothetical protein
MYLFMFRVFLLPFISFLHFFFIYFCLFSVENSARSGGRHLPGSTENPTRQSYIQGVPEVTSIFWEIIVSVILSTKYMCTCVLFRTVSEIELPRISLYSTLYRRAIRYNSVEFTLEDWNPHGKPQPGYQIPRPRFELSTSRTRI